MTLDTTKHHTAELTNGAAAVLPVGELEKKSARCKPLRVKFGMDPTAPNLHLGHAVVLAKLRQFQDAGHTILLLVGDFTARIGDPTGRSKTRPPLSATEINENAQTYFEQVGRVLDRKKIEVYYNAQWLEKITLDTIISIASKITLARLIERDDFSQRLKNQTPITFHELFYPLLQGYDSVVLKADVELGGTDQTFNLLVGRHLQEEYGQEGQTILTMPILEGLDGHQKMSKSLGNAIGLTESPEQVFGKLMSISDKLMWHYYALLLGKTEREISDLQQAITTKKEHPKSLKKKLAFAILSRFWSPEAALEGKNNFESLFEKNDYSQAESILLKEKLPSEFWIIDLLKELHAVTSTSEGKRLIESGAVTINGKRIADFHDRITCTAGTIVKVGKYRIYKLG